MTDHTTEYPDPAEDEWKKKSENAPHGVEGHIGYRCGQCASASPTGVRVTDHGIDYWQNKQLQWQEECDSQMHGYNMAKSLHEEGPTHLPINCVGCPQPTPLPSKPVPPFERALTQLG